MRFEKFKAEGFGCLKGWESPDIDKGLVVVCGRNESGKSTLFKMAETIIYGFSPATAQKHSYVPWDSNYAQCGASLLLNGERYIIGRKLMSRPSAFLKIGDDDPMDIGNNSIPMVDHMPKEVFKEIYALTSDELNLPSQALWEKLKDQLLAGQYYSFIRPAGKVIEELEKEANSLWRPDRRGKPKSKLLNRELGRLRRELTASEENDKRLYELEAKLHQEKATLEELTDEKVKLTAYIDWCDKILPIENKKEQIERLMEEAGDDAPFDHIPSDVEDQLLSREKEIETLREKIKEAKLAIEEFDKKSKELTDVDVALCAHEDQIDKLVRFYGKTAEELDRREKLKGEIDNIQAILKRDGDELIIGGWKDIYMDPLKSIDEAKLRQKVSNYSDVKKEIEYKRAQVSALNVEDPSKLDRSKLMPSGAVFSALGIIGLFLKNTLVKFGGVLFLVAGIVSIVFGVATLEGERQRRELAQRADGDLKRLQNRLGEVQEDIHRCLQGIPLASVDEAYMGEAIIADVDRLKMHMEKLSALRMEYTYITHSIEEKIHTTDMLMSACMLEPAQDILANIDYLNKSLKVAKDRRYRKEEAEKKVKSHMASMEDMKDTLKKVEEERNTLLLNLEKFNGNTVEEKVQDLSRRRELYLKAQILTEQLEIEKSSLPSNCFDSYNKGYIGDREIDKNVLNFQELAHAKVRIEEIDRELNDLSASIGALESELEYGQGQKTAYQIKGEIEAVKKELDDVAYRRDRLMLLRNIIDKADRQFKDEHQPDVFSRAGEYLSIITGGKYTRIFISEEDGDQISILQRDNPYPIEVGETISRGTQEQIYLSLRLALMDHLDGEQPMPAFLDEVFINWDNIRIQNSMELIREIGRRRQVFIFTCHRWLVDLLSHNLDVQIIIMG